MLIASLKQSCMHERYKCRLVLAETIVKDLYSMYFWFAKCQNVKCESRIVPYKNNVHLFGPIDYNVSFNKQNHIGDVEINVNPELRTISRRRLKPLENFFPGKRIKIHRISRIKKELGSAYMFECIVSILNQPK